MEATEEQIGTKSLVRGLVFNFTDCNGTRWIVQTPAVDKGQTGSTIQGLHRVAKEIPNFILQPQMNAFVW